MLKEKVRKMIEIGISLKSFSSLSGIHYTTLSKWINDEQELNRANKEKIENALKILAEQLFNILNI